MSPEQPQASKKIPVTILTGFLGSGKTTLLNHILTSPDHGLKFAIIENEFGDIGVDDKILKVKEDSGEEQIVETMNGCICCTVRGDLVKVMEKLKERIADFDAVIIETTGLADPAPVAQTFLAEQGLVPFYVLDAIITVVDAKHWLQHVREEKPEGVENESSEQVAFADRILLNKTDLVDEEQLKEVEGCIKSINCSAQVYRTQHGKIDPSKLLGIKAFSLQRVLEMDPEFLNADGEHQHDASVSSVSFSFDGEVNVNRMEKLIEVMLKTNSQNLFRYKGLLAVKGWKQKYVFHGVHMLHTGTFAQGHTWQDGETRKSVLVFIGRDLNKEFLENLWKACLAPEELRFKVGDEIEAYADGKFVVGRVTKTWDDQGNPYEVQLADGQVVTAPDDLDNFVRVKRAKVSE